MPSESELLDWIRAQQPRGNGLVQHGIGDDLAVLKWNPCDLLLVGIDQVLDGVHFDSTKHSPRDIGRKAMNRNISDCAAMACLPAAAVASVALPRGGAIEFAKELYLGMRDAADKFGCAIVGGDTSAWGGKLAISVAILGRNDGIEPITRGGAKPGDSVYVTGPLGGSILGRHLSFEPRVSLARELAKAFRITSMIDISDGLSCDLRAICMASGVSAVVDALAIPIHDDAKRLADTGKSAIDHALHDGEDHELLFTSPDRIDRGDCVRIGQITVCGSNPTTVEIEQDGKRSSLAVHGWEARW